MRMQQFRFITVIVAALLMSGCLTTPITLNGTTMLFGKIDTISIEDADSVVYSRGNFIIKSSVPITVNGRKVSVAGSSGSIGGIKFDVDEDYQVVVDHHGNITLKLMKTKVAAAPEEKPEE